MVTVALPCGLYATFFDSEPLAQRDVRPNYGRETDYGLGWTRKLGSYVVDASATYLNVDPLTVLPRGDVLQLSERVTQNFSFNKKNAITPYLWLRQAMPMRGSTPVGGSFIHTGAGFTHAFDKRVSASLAMEAVHDSGAFGYRPGYIGRIIASANWNRNYEVNIQFPQVTFTDPLSHTKDGRGPELTFGLGFSFSPGH